MKNMKKWLSVLLTVAMLATTLCMPVFAADSAATSDKTVAGEYVYNFLNGEISGTTQNMNFFDYATKTKWKTATNNYTSSDYTLSYSGEDTYVAQIKLKDLTVDGSTIAAATQFNEFTNNRFYIKGGTEYNAEKSKYGFVPISGVGDGKADFGDRGTTLGNNIREMTYVSSTFGILATVTWEQKYVDATGFVDSLLTVTYQALPGYEYTDTSATWSGATTDADANGIYDALEAGYLSVFSKGTKGEYAPMMFQVGTDGDTTDIRNGLCYVFRLSDGTFVIYDGGGNGGMTEIEDEDEGNGNVDFLSTGTVEVADRLLAVLREYNVLDKVTVSAWVITHPHNDHMNVFGNIVNRINTGTVTDVQVNGIIANIPDWADQTTGTASRSSVSAESMMVYHGLLDTMASKGAYVYKAHVGQKYFFADASIEILYTHDMHEGKIPNGNRLDGNDKGDGNDINGISIISQVTLWEGGNTYMMTGDASYRGIDWVNAAYGDELASDYVQAPHHGHPSCFLQHNAYDGVDHLDGLRKFYNLVEAKYLLWPTSGTFFEKTLNVSEDTDEADNGIKYSTLSQEDVDSGLYPYEIVYKEDGVTVDHYLRTGIDVPTREYSRKIGMSYTFIGCTTTAAFEYFNDDGEALSKHKVTYLLRTQKDLKQGLGDMDGYYKLMNDILINQDIDGENDGVLNTYLIRSSFVAANAADEFAGTLDGDGHSIILADGMSFSPASSNVGLLFKTLYNGTVKNLGLGTATAPIIYNTKQANVGVLAGAVAVDATPVVDGVEIYTTLDGTGRTTTANIGGIVGNFANAGASLTVKNSTIDISFIEGTTTVRNVGGLVGYFRAASSINAIGNTVNVDITTAATGASCYAGLIAKADVAGGTIYAENNTVALTVEDTSTAAVEHSIGGVIGYVGNTIASTKGNTVTIDVNDTTSSTTAHNIGGVAGRIAAAEGLSFNLYGDRVSGTIKTTAGNAHHTGGILGSTTVNGAVNITNAYSNATITSATGNTRNVGGIVGENRGAAGLLSIDSCTFEGSLTGTGRTGGILACNSGYVDIDNCFSNGTISSSSNTGGVIGYDNSSSRAATISNTTNSSSVSGSGSYFGGILGVINTGASTYNITNCLNTGSLTSSKVGVGGIVGGVYNGSTAKINITRCVNSGAVENTNTGTNYYTAGGIMGVVNNDGATVTITSCVNDGTVTGGKVSGGILGYAGAHDSLAYNITIKDCYNTGNIDGPRIGGIVGSAMHSTAVANTLVIDGCYNSGKMTVATWGGGILGMGSPATPSGTLLSVVTVKNCVNNGTITNNSGKTERVGAFAGAGRSYVTIDNCVNYDSNVGWIGTQDNAVKGVFSNMYTYNCTVPTMDFVGASMRIVETETYVSGLTFKGQVDTAMLDAYMAATHPTGGYTIVKDIKVGMLVVPTHMLEKCNNIFTATSVAAAEAVEFTLEELRADNGSFYTSLVGFDTDWANTEFSVITYVSFKISSAEGAEWITIYGDYDPDNARSIGYVANETKGLDAYNDYSDAQKEMIDTYAELYVKANAN